MSLFRKLTIALAICAASVSCTTIADGGTGGIFDDDPTSDVDWRIPDFPCLVFNKGTEGQALRSPIAGTVVAATRNSDGSSNAFVVTEALYFWMGRRESVEFEFIFCNVRGEVPRGELNIGDSVGTIGQRSFMTTRHAEFHHYLALTTMSDPNRRGGYWYFSPDWLIPTVLQPLSFRQADSFEFAIADFYDRWAREGQEPRGATLHFFPELDRIRVKTTIESLPVPATRTNALTLVEMQLYRSLGLFTHEIALESDLPYTPVLYWSASLREYLADEYELGTETYLYCSILALDHDTKTIVICVRDFIRESDEDRYRELKATFDGTL